MEDKSLSFDKILTPEEREVIAVEAMKDWIERERRGYVIRCLESGEEIPPHLLRYLPDPETFDYSN